MSQQGRPHDGEATSSPRMLVDPALIPVGGGACSLLLFSCIAVTTRGVKSTVPRSCRIPPAGRCMHRFHFVRLYATTTSNQPPAYSSSMLLLPSTSTCSHRDPIDTFQLLAKHTWVHTAPWFPVSPHAIRSSLGSYLAGLAKQVAHRRAAGSTGWWL